MLKIERLIVVILILLAFSVVGLLSISKNKNIKVPQENTKQAADKDFGVNGVVEEILGSLFKIKITSGEINDYLLTNQVIYLCLSNDEDYYNYLKDKDRENLDPKYLINKEDILNKITVGDKVELFLYEYSQDKVFIKAIADYNC